MQKTAYEMRISDWRSDVFSSDLRRVDDGAVARRTRGRGGDIPAARPARRPARDRSAPLGQGADRLSRARSERPQRWRGPDRKSVVWGESGSVRVALGGCRNIKKKQ